MKDWYSQIGQYIVIKYVILSMFVMTLNSIFFEQKSPADTPIKDVKTTIVIKQR